MNWVEILPFQIKLNWMDFVVHNSVTMYYTLDIQSSTITHFWFLEGNWFKSLLTDYSLNDISLSTTRRLYSKWGDVKYIMLFRHIKFGGATTAKLHSTIVTKPGLFHNWMKHDLVNYIPSYIQLFVNLAAYLCFKFSRSRVNWNINIWEKGMKYF